MTIRSVPASVTVTVTGLFLVGSAASAQILIREDSNMFATGDGKVYGLPGSKTRAFKVPAAIASWLPSPAVNSSRQLVPLMDANEPSRLNWKISHLGADPATARPDPFTSAFRMGNQFVNQFFLGNFYQNKGTYNGNPGLYSFGQANNVLPTGTAVGIMSRFDYVAGGEHRTGMLQSRKKYLYGYYEAKVTGNPFPLVSTFWLHTGNSMTEWTGINSGEPFRDNREIDFEIFDRKLHVNLYVLSDRYYANPWAMKSVSFGEIPKFQYSLTLNPANDVTKPHVYGFWWNPSFLRFYVDGHRMLECPNTFLHEPMYVVFSTHVFPKEDFTYSEAQLRAANGSSAKIDYVRTWYNPASSYSSYHASPTSATPLALDYTPMFVYGSGRTGPSTTAPFDNGPFRIETAYIQ